MFLPISIILPIYNEESNIDNVVKASVAYLGQIREGFEVILVNDGSSDNSGIIAKRLSNNNENIKYVSHSRNLGYGAALRSGFNVAKNPLIFFMDCDGQFDISDLYKLLEHIDTADIVIGDRKIRQDKTGRILLTKIFNFFAKSLFRVKFNDISCGFKLIKKPVLEDLTLKSHSGIVNLEILLRATRKGYIVKEVEINHFPRVMGRSKGARLKNIVRKIKELIILTFDLRNHKC